MEHIKSAKPIAEQRVSLPGEIGDEKARMAETSGEIETADPIWSEFINFVNA